MARKPKPTTLFTWVSEDRGRGLLRGEPFTDRVYTNPPVEGVFLLSEPECYLDSLHQKNLWTLKVILDLKYADLRDHELVEEGLGYRQFCPPADFVNAHLVRVELFDDQRPTR